MLCSSRFGCYAGNNLIIERFFYLIIRSLNLIDFANLLTTWIDDSFIRSFLLRPIENRLANLRDAPPTRLLIKFARVLLFWLKKCVAIIRIFFESISEMKVQKRPRCMIPPRFCLGDSVRFADAQARALYTWAFRMKQHSFVMSKSSACIGACMHNSLGMTWSISGKKAMALQQSRWLFLLFANN